MALPSSIISGQSNAPASVNNRGTFEVGSGIFGSVGTPNNVDRAIESKISGKTLEQITFPSDVTKYHFNIVQNQWRWSPNPLEAGGMIGEKIFKLPFPRELMDKNEVNYDTNFNFLNLFGRAARLASSTIGQGTSAVTGWTVNNFKAVTLDVPSFKTHSLSWTLAPKNFQEAHNIQRIIFGLKKAMAPRNLREAGKTTPIIGFPKIFTLYFSANPQSLFKFKPCVLASLIVDYTGGSQVPAFFAGPENPPESVTITTLWIELEYWLDTDFISNPSDASLPSTDALDGMSWYNYRASFNEPSGFAGTSSNPGGRE